MSWNVARDAVPRDVVIRNVLGRVGRVGESIVTVGILILLSTAILPLLFHGGRDWPDLSPPGPTERLTYWLAYLFTLAQVLIRPRAVLRAALRNPFVPGVVVVAAVSAGWADDGATTLRRAGALGMWTLFGLFLVSRYHPRQVLTHLAAALGIIAVLSLLAGLIVPDLGLEHGFNEGAWRGVFTTKNVLGETMLLASIVFWILLRGREGRWFRPLIGVALPIVLIGLSRSATAIIIGISVLVIVPAIVAFSRGGVASMAAVVCLLTIGAAAPLAMLQRELVLGRMGKDVTLTGRTTVWMAVSKRIAERPLLGYGYSGFWERGSAISEALRAAVGWDTPHSHNGFLDMWLDLGLLGLLTLLSGFAFAAKRAWVALRAGITLEGVWATSFLVVLLLLDMVESPLYQNMLFWTVFVAVAAMIPVKSQEIAFLSEVSRPSM